MATAAGTPALAMFVIRSRRVIATLDLFLARAFFCVGGFDSFGTGLFTALETLRVNVGRSTECTGDRTCQTRGDDRNSTNRVVDGRIRIGRSREVDGDGFERTHLPNHALFGAAHAGNSSPDRPAIRNLVEMA